MFEGENFREFQGLRAIRSVSFLHEILGHAPHPLMFGFKAICESFLHEILTSYSSVKVFSLKSLPLYSIIASSTGHSQFFCM